MPVAVPDPIAMDLPNKVDGKVDGDYPNHPDHSRTRRDEDEEQEPPTGPNFGL